MKISDSIELLDEAGVWNVTFNGYAHFTCTDEHGRILTYSLDKTPSQLSADERIAILDYCLGDNNYLGDELVTIADIFLHGEFISLIPDGEI